MEFLGRMLLMTIREEISVPFETFATVWREQGLDPKLLPLPRTAPDAFRRATPRRKWQNGYAMLDYKGGQHLPDSELEVVLVLSRDSKRRVDIHHGNRAILYLTHEGDMQVEPITPLIPQEEAYVAQVLTQFAKARTHIDGSQCRGVIQKLLTQADALTYRDGSYLVPRAHFPIADAIVNLVDFVQEYTPGPRNICWDLPYIDTEDTRIQISKALMDHLARVCNSVHSEARKLKPEHLHKKNVGRSRRGSLRTILESLSPTIDAYVMLLGHELPTHRSRLAGAANRLEAILRSSG